MDLADQLGDLDDAIKEAVLSQLGQMKMTFTLTYSMGKSLFMSEEGGTGGAIMAQASGTIYADYGQKRMVSQEGFFGRTFLIDEELTQHPWKMGSETRTIAGRTCTKATLEEEGEPTVTAWFSAETPIPAGPMGYWGLPGLIVELDIQGASYVMTDITVLDKPAAITPPTKGKKVTRQEMRETMERVMKQMGVGLGGTNVQVIQMGN